MIKVVKNEDNKIKQYRDYLRIHISNVIKSYELIENKIRDELISDGVNVNELKIMITNHDQSKYGEEEFDPYLIHWYGNPTEVDETEYYIAWLHHIHNNPHHWQHWILLSDPKTENRMKALDMPLKYIIEMLCDWHSFSAKDSKSTAYNWYYNDGKELMMFSENTVKYIEKYIEYFKEPLY